MCGIAGHVGPRNLDGASIDACLLLMGRRGPDAKGVHRYRNDSHGAHVDLLHSRLSIIDLDHRSDQPFRAGEHVIAYNGELYNYVEVAERLRAAGVALRTDGDTEVLLRTVVRGGPAALDTCEGMWAFALLDEQAGSLLLSRDRFGEKPLYLFREGRDLYFASEPKFLFALLGRSLPVDYDHLRRYLVNGYKALYKTPAQFFEGLQELQPGCWLRVGPSGHEEFGRYWTPEIHPDESMSYSDAVSGARHALIEAVRLRLRADVPLAFCMSGGVDSISLISIAKRVFDYDVHGFTIVNDDERYDEKPLVDLAVRELGIRHTEVPNNTASFLERLRVLVRQHDAPVYTITYYAQWLLMEAIAAHGYKISISGTAADELFSGYFDHHLAYLAAVRDDVERHQVALAEWSEHIRPLVRNPFLRDADLFVDDPKFRDHIFLDADTFGSYLTAAWSEPFAEEQFHPEVLRNRMLNELLQEAVPVILHEDDRNAMFYSIENRSPFLDRHLFDLCGRVPTRHLVQRGFAKAVLRDAVRGIAPAPIIDNHRKVGFNAPIFDYLDVHDKEVRAEIFADSPVWDLIRRDAIERLLAKEQLPNSESKFLFYFLNAKMFLEEFAS